MNRKLELTKKKRLLAEQKRKERLDAIKANKELTNAIDRLYELINGQESYDFAKLEKQLEQIDKSLDLSKHFKNLERSIEKNSPHKSTLKTKITDFSKLLDAVKKNKPIDQRVDISKLEKAVINIEQYIRDNSEPSDQGAENYQPFRRVIKTGNRFIFDDNYYNNGGGGSAIQDNLISNNRVKVDVGTSIDVGEVEVKNDSGNPVPISGTVTIDTTGLATSATDTNTGNIDTNIGAKADASATTDTGSFSLISLFKRLLEKITTLNAKDFSTSAKQDIIIGHVDGVETLLGTIDADTGNIATNTSTIAGAVSGTEMQVDVVTGVQTDALTDTELRASAIEVDGSGVTQPVSGTVTANLSATDNTVLDNIDSNTAPTTGLNTGRKVVTTAGTAVAIASSTTCKWVAITAETDNTGYIVVGDSGVIASLSTREGVPLNAGDSIVIPIDNLSDVYIDSTVSGEGVTFTYGT